MSIVGTNIETRSLTRNVRYIILSFRPSSLLFGSCPFSQPDFPVFVNEVYLDHVGSNGFFVEVAFPNTTSFEYYTIEIFEEQGSSLSNIGTLATTNGGSMGQMSNGLQFFTWTLPTAFAAIAVVDDWGFVLEFLSLNENEFPADGGAVGGSSPRSIGVTQSKPGETAFSRQGSGCISNDFTWMETTIPTKGDVNDLQTIPVGCV